MAKIAREYLRTRHDAHTQCAYDTLAAAAPSAASHTVHLSWLRIMLIRLCSSGSSSTSSKSSELFATCCQALCAACCCCCYFVVAVIIVIVLHFTDIVVPSIKGLFYAYISNELQQQQKQQQRSRAGSRTSRILCKLLFAMKTIVVCCCMCIGMHIAMPYLLRVSLSLSLPLSSHNWIPTTMHCCICLASLLSLSLSLYCAAPASVRSFRPLSATGIFGFV